MKGKLLSLVGQHVRLNNQSFVDMESVARLSFQVHGKLQQEPDNAAAFSVLVGDDPGGHGTNAITFLVSSVAEVYRQPSGIWEITLK